MIHIVFQANDKEVLKEAMALDPQIQGEVLQIADDFAVGPIQDFPAGESLAMRRQWWRDILATGDYEGIVDDGSVPDDEENLVQLIRKMKEDPGETLWIWVAQNGHDVSGYFWLIGKLSALQGRVFILSLNNLPFINTKGAIFYPRNLFNIPAREFVKAKKLAREVTAAEFESDPEEWKRLGNENKGVRILEGSKKLLQFDYDYYDTDLKRFLTGEWMKAGRLIHLFLSKAPNITGDAYLLWRVKQIVAAHQMEAQGELRYMKDFEVRAKSAMPVSDLP
jgi:hypothetical protein